MFSTATTDPVLKKTPPTINIRLSKAAQVALTKQGTVLNVEMDLLFSCLIKKQVFFKDKLHPDSILFRIQEPYLQVGFRAIGTKVCLISEHPLPETETFPIQKPTAFLPKWLELDFKKDQWHGEFGYGSKPW